MDSNDHPKATAKAPPAATAVKVFGVGGAGLKVLEEIAARGLPGASLVAVGSNEEVASAAFAAEKIVLETRLLRGMGTGGDPERGRAVAEEHLDKLQSACAGAGVVFIVSGLGGGGGTGISPVLARAAKSAGALVLGFVTLPFDCEGSRRRQQARRGLERIKTEADGVVCLPNQRVFKLIDGATSVRDTFQLTNQLLADGVSGVWRLINSTGLLPIHFNDLSAVLRDRHRESAFATAQAAGPTRASDAVKQLLEHPLLDGGKILAESDTLLVSLTGGASLAMADVNRVMEAVNDRCQHAQVLMGAAIDERLGDTLMITLIAARRAEISEDAEVEDEPGTESALAIESLDTQLHARPTGTRRHSRFAPPPPMLSPEKIQQLMATQAVRTKGRKGQSRMRQGQLPLEIISKGRFDKSEPTIHKGEDLDVPTYIRRGVPLN